MPVVFQKEKLATKSAQEIKHTKKQRRVLFKRFRL